MSADLHRRPLTGLHLKSLHGIPRNGAIIPSIIVNPRAEEPIRYLG